ncbi:protein regulator of cytokinesis 1-like isoform X2 [Anoplophora glabripennis]|uniref:protein regulator of cytokinesis 1-like isoform X2 n=1 Tax=Anoplophora glabripennis TaxID=217634 RepID=UPI000873CD92|nr:protein regulator of cytokinesis 1-like isoform X2 [Anoplophora glabripennis]
MECQKEKFIDLPTVNANIIKEIPWAEEMRNVLEDGLSKTFLYWCQMVLNMGENEEVVKSWVSIFIKTYEETCCELVSDMERVQSNVLLKIEQLLKEFEQLCYTLQISMPVLGDTTQKLSLHQEQQELKKHINEYKKLIEVRRCEQKKLHEKQLELCNMLGKEPKILMDNPLPSPEKLEEFQQHIEKLEAEKYNRLEKFCTVKEELLEIVSELNVEPSSQFEKKVFSSDDSVFLVTDENMKQLDLLHKNLTRQQKNVKEEIVHLRNKIDDYWNLLDIDLKEREDFRQKHIGNSLDVLRALQKEIKRCEELKKANIKVFIDKLRNELKQLWENCHCSHTTRMQFGFFNSDCYNEDLLELHEVEITKWKKYYEENKELLALLEKHAGLWNKMVGLEENATGPNRYNNRGGQLLKEEKERNKLAKQIPQIEEMLYNLADKYKQHQNVSFTTEGISVLDYLSNLHEQRENAKKQKLSARKMQREQTLTPAKSALSLFPSTSHMNLRSGTPQSTTKRKHGTPMTNETKRLKVLSERKPQKGNNTPIPTIKITSISKRLSMERKKRINKIRRLSSKKEASHSNETFTADYGKFQERPLAFSSVCGTIIE